MPAFDIVSEIDIHALTNAVDQARRIITTRFDFKGVEASFVREERTVLLTAEAEIQLEQMQDMLRGAAVKCGLSTKAMDVGEMQSSGKQVKQSISFRHGLDADSSRKIIRAIKDSKLKVQTQTQDDQVRVSGKKRDDLQQVIALLRDLPLDYPLQYQNFRD